MTVLSLLRRFWWMIPLLGLLVTVLWQRNDLTATHAKLATADARVADVTKANAGLSDALSSVRAMRVDNDAIATAVATKLGSNTAWETNTRTIIEKAAANDPAVSNWGGVPVPDSVRAALRSDSGNP